MTPWDRYIALITAHPELVESPADGSGIRILTDAEVVQREQARLRAAGQEPVATEFGVLSEDPWLYVVRDLVEFPDGRRNGYTRVINRKTLESGTTGVCVLPVCQGRIVLVKHFRHALRAYLWEVPRGFAEPGTAPEDNVRREIREELGAEALRVVRLAAGQPDSAILRAAATFYFAEITEPSPDWKQAAAADGIIDQRAVTPAELQQMIFAGEIVDVFTITAYSLARLRGLVE